MLVTAEGSEQRPMAKRRFRNYLLDSNFQMRWVLRVTLATIIIVAAMGYFLYGTVSDASDQILAQKLGDLTLTPEAQTAFIQQNETDKWYTLGTLIGGLVLLVFMLGVVTIVLTHKIAGPVFKLKKLFASIDGNHLQLWAKLRKGDELQDVFIEFDEMLRRLREHRRQDVEEMDAIRQLLADGDSSDGARERVNQLMVRYRDSVKMD